MIRLIVFFLIIPVFGADEIIDVETFLKEQCFRLGLNIPAFSKKTFHKEDCDKDKLVSVCMRNGETHRKLTVYDKYNELMYGCDFCPRYLALKGTRKVGIYSVDGVRRLCFKQCPEAPANEYASYELCRRLFYYKNKHAMPLPANEVVVMNGVVFLVSEFMEGVNLEEVFKALKQKQFADESIPFNVFKFQSLAVLCLLLNPEDCRPQNCLLRSNQNGLLEICLVDHDRNFCKELVFDKKGEIFTRVHCSVFCFNDLMQKKINFNPFRWGGNKKIDEWYESCRSYQKFLVSLEPVACQGRASLKIFVGNSIARSIKFKVRRINTLLKKSKKGKTNFLAIFRALMPEIHDIYNGEFIFNNKDTLRLACELNSFADGGRCSFDDVDPETPLSASLHIADFMQRSASDMNC